MGTEDEMPDIEEDGSMGGDCSFTLRSFLAERAITLFACVGVLAIASVIMAVVGAPAHAIALVGVIATVSIASATMVEFIRERDFWRTLKSNSESLDSTMHFVELSPEASTRRQAIALVSASNVAAMASSELGRLRTESSDARRYMDLWVHETKTPLSAAKLIASRIDDKPAGTAIMAELERIDSQVAQALFAGRATHLEADYSIRETPLLELASEVCKQNMHLLIERGVSVDIDIDPGIRVLADTSWTSFIISQIISNSAKYDSTRITISAVLPSAESPDSATILSISDDGCGIPAQDAPRIFDRGFIGEVGRSHGSATGMGLYLVANMCDKMGLGLEVTSEEAVGTTVCISFPHDRRLHRLTSRNLTRS